jgi:hypothetical protein
MDWKNYRKKPIIVQAYRWKFTDEIVKSYPLERFSTGKKECSQCGKDIRLHGLVETLEGTHIACPGDYIIKGVKGEVYPCKPDIFDKTYEEVSCGGNSSTG